MEVRDSASDAYFWGAHRVRERTNVDKASQSAVYSHGMFLVANGLSPLF